MTEVKKLLEKMKDRNEIRQFERNYGTCFLQECASISTNILTFNLNHVTMSISNYYDDDMSDDEYREDCVYFDDFGTGIGGLPFDCTEDEFRNAKLINSHITFNDLPVLKEMYARFKQYLDMKAVKKYAKK